MKMLRPLLALSLLLLSGLIVSLSAQSAPHQTEGSADEKSEEIMKKALEAVGGNSFLNVRTVVGRGFFTGYQEGVSQLPTRFLDYISYPDKERTEFTSSGIKAIQTNFGEQGWLYDGATKTLTDMKTPQVEDFKRGMRTSVENLLRGWWRKEKGSVKYVGRREAGVGMRNETVRLTYPNGFWIEYEFGARDGKPAKIIYRRERTKADSNEVEEVKEEDHLLKFITVDGVTAPWVIDHLINGFQTSRINYESIEYNRVLPDTLFVKPENIKSLK
jgi:hypothetical protein